LIDGDYVGLLLKVGKEGWEGAQLRRMEVARPIPRRCARRAGACRAGASVCGSACEARAARRRGEGWVSARAEHCVAAVWEMLTAEA